MPQAAGSADGGSGSGGGGGETGGHRQHALALAVPLAASSDRQALSQTL